jgi:hypothetical protein
LCLHGDDDAQFAKWRHDKRSNPIVAGCWSRPLFVGEFKHTDASTERVFNVQTGSIFLDLRLPLSTEGDIFKGHTSLSTLSLDQLRLFARRHAFAGYSLVTGGGKDDVSDPPVATRHHAIDWNCMRPLHTQCA